MRTLFAGLFCIIGLLSCVGVVFNYYPDGFKPAWLTGVFFAVVLLVLVAVSMFLFDRPGQKPSLKSFAEQLAELERQGLLVSETYHATRAFRVEEFEDEGIHYFIELADNRILCLNGQYLYDYEEIKDASESNQPRKFPCTEFTVVRHKVAGYLVDLKVAGEVLPLDCVAPPFDKQDFKRDLIYEDGLVICDRPYEDLKRERLKQRPA